MYKAVNTMVAEKGLDTFNFKLKKTFITTVMEDVNKAGANARGFDTVSTKVRRRDRSIFDLLARAQPSKAKIAAGEQVSKEELYSEEAIAMPEDGGDQEEGGEDSAGDDEAEDDEDYRKGKRKHSNTEENSSNKRSRTREGADAAQAEATASASASDNE